MKCSKCGNEIPNDSLFCEYCGKKIHSKVSRKTFLGLLAVTTIVLAFGGVVNIDNFFEQKVGRFDDVEWANAVDSVAFNFVDLGLPSGTKWNSENVGEFLYFNEAVSHFYNNLPSKAQWEELKDKCQWAWTGSGYDVFGPNGNSIFLPAAGYPSRDGLKRQDEVSFYWSSTRYESEEAWFLYFNSDEVYTDHFPQRNAISVRLVQN